MTPQGESKLVELSRTKSKDGTREVVVSRQEGTFNGKGEFLLDYYIYYLLGIDLRKMNGPLLTTLRIPPRILCPFLVIILVSLVTRSGTKEALDRYYVKMKTPVLPNPEDDSRELAISYQSPSRFDHKKLFPNTNFEIQQPTMLDLIGFVLCIGVCCAILALASFVANIGS